MGSFTGWWSCCDASHKTSKGCRERYCHTEYPQKKVAWERIIEEVTKDMEEEEEEVEGEEKEVEEEETEKSAI